MRIDAHTHMGMGLAYASSASLCRASTGSELIELLRAAGIDMAVTFAPPWKGGFIDPDYKQANRMVFEAVSEYPDRLVGYAWVNPKFGEGAIREARKCIEEYGLKGFKLHPNFDSFSPLDEKLVFPVMELASEWKLPVLFHSGDYPVSAPMVFLPLAERFPAVNIILAHIGYQLVADAIFVAQRAHNVFLDTAENTPIAVTQAVKQIGADRVIYGSDTPYHIMEVEAAKISFLPGISEEDKALILGGNIARILGLEDSHLMNSK